MKKAIDFTIILPVCHGGHFLRMALSSIRRLDYLSDRMEVLVAGAEQDAVSRGIVRDEAVSSGYDIFHISCARSSRAAMLNVACAVARGRVLVFADDDCVFLPDWLQKLDDVFERENNIGVVGGLDRAGPNEPPLNIALDYVLNSFAGTGGLRSKKGPRVGKYYPKLWNMAILREVALGVAIRGREGPSQVFNEALDVHEDVELIDRIEKTGKQIIFAPEVIVMHSRDTTILSFTRRSFNMARTSRSVGVHRLPHISLAAFILGMIVLTVASVVSEPLRIVLVGTGAIYIMTLLLSAIVGFIRTRQFSIFIYVPLLLMALHFSRGLGFLFPWHSRRLKEGIT
jgi:GT2 family glycosyltransferase